MRILVKCIFLLLSTSVMCSCLGHMKQFDYENSEVVLILKGENYIASRFESTNWCSGFKDNPKFAMVNTNGISLNSTDFCDIAQVAQFCSSMRIYKRCPLHPKGILRDDGYCYSCHNPIVCCQEYVYQEENAFWHFIDSSLYFFEIRPSYNSTLRAEISGNETVFIWPWTENEVLTILGTPTNIFKRCYL